VSSLLKLSGLIDWITDRFAVLAKWAVLLACFISCTNALVRYGLNYSSNAYLEIQWYLFAACVMMGAAQVLRVNEHVRVDVLYGRYGGKGQAIVDLLGLTFFLLPTMVVMLYFSWPWFYRSWDMHELSSNAGGLILWPAKAMLPLGFALVLIQGVSEIIKRVAWLAHKYEGDFHYERPLQ